MQVRKKFALLLFLFFYSHDIQASYLRPLLKTGFAASAAFALSSHHRSKAYSKKEACLSKRNAFCLGINRIIDTIDLEIKERKEASDKTVNTLMAVTSIIDGGMACLGAPPLITPAVLFMSSLPSGKGGKERVRENLDDLRKWVYDVSDDEIDETPLFFLTSRVYRDIKEKKSLLRKIDDKSIRAAISDRKKTRQKEKDVFFKSQAFLKGITKELDVLYYGFAGFWSYYEHKHVKNYLMVKKLGENSFVSTCFDQSSFPKEKERYNEDGDGCYINHIFYDYGPRTLFFWDKNCGSFEYSYKKVDFISAIEKYNDRYLLVGTDKGGLDIFDIKKNKIVYTLYRGYMPIKDIYVINDTIITEGDYEVAVWKEIK